MNNSVRESMIGNGILIICCMFYLSWWMLAFRPEYKASRTLCTILLIFAFVAGITGLYETVHGMNSLTMIRKHFSSGFLIGGGIVVYVLLVIFTWLIFKRQITSELFLFTGWALLELSVLNCLYGANLMPLQLAVILSVVVGVSVILSLVCYSIYYHLDDQARYIDGMIPLIIDAIVMGAIIISSYRCIKG